MGKIARRVWKFVVANQQITHRKFPGIEGISTKVECPKLFSMSDKEFMERFVHVIKEHKKD